MPNPKASTSFTLCELYDVFKNLEEAFGYFADILAGIKCQGLDCDTHIPIDPNARDILDWLLEHRAPGSNGGGGWPTCDGSPCLTSPGEFLDKLKEFSKRAPNTADAAAMMLKRFTGSEIEFMTRTAMKKRG